MIKRIGYACINNSLKPRTFQQCRLNSVYKYGIEYLREKIINNLKLTKDIIKWNVDNGIFMYRATSTLLPLVDHPDVLRDFQWKWQKDQEILKIMDEIKNIVQENNIRLSMHPDQFTVLNSTKRTVVENSINYLNFHYQILTLLGGKDIIIHTGGVYGDKTSAINRFIEEYKKLPEGTQKMLRLENDDVSFNIDDVLYISEKTSIPIILDVHHHRCNKKRDISYQDIYRIKESWEDTGMIPKMHISSGKTGIYDKSHSDYIKEEDIISFISLIEDIDVDLMVEAKEKDNAALKVMGFVKRGNL
ncbi:UV DNA damage repair endonuclease UvsE [Clostridium frigidicarnis]|uniref:UV-damage endonuclease n=1 Tax=Clostridium frigidicarnis TaxID=84698 RepID=A0A1I0V7R5_9CLOT|nr:UV DNA damage repair endonuclease UvsE [Clostridium frigidicarnis]SFA72399.1 UV-damage endonuclease [Clostridium frigidicarnis]